MQDLRKGKGLTQEDLAHKVGVSGQAVSKWENDLSYPDITLIPDLASILETDIAYLFGKQPDAPVPQSKIPDSYQGLPLVHTTDHVACYSDKLVESNDATSVKFADGSTAELSTRLAVNSGQGNILFVTLSDIDPTQSDSDLTITSKDFEFGCSRNLSISIPSCICKIIRSADDKTRVSAKGVPKFLHLLKVEHDSASMLLKIGYEQTDNNNSNFNKSDNQLLVELPVDSEGENMELRINGSGEIRSEIQQFSTGKLRINGSGNIHVQEFSDSCDAAINGSGNINGTTTNALSIKINGSGNVIWNEGQEVHVKINGSGDVNLGKAQHLGAKINGSGDITVEELTGKGDFSTKISGSGDIRINSGNCHKFNVDINGNGDIHASNVTANTAHIVIRHGGSVTLGHVVESSTEQIKKKGTITILKRGI